MTETNTIAVYFYEDERGSWWDPQGEYIRECDQNDIDVWDSDDYHIWDEVYDASSRNIPHDADSLADLYDYAIVYDDGKSWLVVRPKD